MARAMARGWAGTEERPERMLFTDSGSGRAQQLADEVGGEAVASNEELAESSDLLVLAVKPAALGEVAEEAGGAANVLSLLAATPIARVAAAFPEATVSRAMPTVAVEVRRGAICFAGSPDVKALLEPLGKVVEIADSDFDAATAVMGCSPAYVALVVEAIAEAGAAHGLDPRLSRSLMVESTAGAVELLRRYEPAELRRAVASPGGATEAGLEALEREGAAHAFEEAVNASIERMST